jgi:dimethylargininase
MRPRALVRAVPATFDRALSARAPDPAIDVARARAQHAAYVEGLEWLGYDVETVPADDRHPDCVFIEDTAVVARGVALVTRSAAASRGGEGDAVAEALAAHVRVERMRPPATLDGGDVLRLGATLYAGRSPRTNAAGVDALAATFAPAGLTVVPVAIDGMLHLKCACSPLSDERLLLDPSALSQATFQAASVCVPAGEAYAANAVARAGRVLLSAGHPGTRRALEDAGLEVRELETSEFRKADGSLTCLSLRLDDVLP